MFKPGVPVPPTLTTCTKCSLHQYRRWQVPGRGPYPAHVLFVGEGPGISEDLMGEAFVGPSGKLLAQAIAEAMDWAQSRPTCHFTNVVQCRPCSTKGGTNRPPTKDEAWACRPNLMAVTQAVSPLCVVLLGDVAFQLCRSVWPEAYKIQHPAFVLRRGGTCCPEFRTMVAGLTQVFEYVLLQRRSLACRKRRKA